MKSDTQMDKVQMIIGPLKMASTAWKLHQTPFVGTWILPIKHSLSVPFAILGIVTRSAL